MLQDNLLDELKMIAFCDAATASNRVSACLSLYKNGFETVRIVDVLDEIATASATPDSARIKAIDLVSKILNETGPAVSEHSVDVASITEILMEQYTGCQTP